MHEIEKKKRKGTRVINKVTTMMRINLWGTAGGVKRGDYVTDVYINIFITTNLIQLIQGPWRERKIRAMYRRGLVCNIAAQD